jgi:hypothetical protein
MSSKVPETLDASAAHQLDSPCGGTTQSLNKASSMATNIDNIDSFRALALQVTCHAVNQASDRRRPGLNNLLSRQRFELYAQSSRQSHFYPANTMLDKEVDRKHFIQTQQETIERLGKLGII